MSMLKKEHKQEQKNKVLNSALACFSSKGYEAATIDDIVTHSEISKGTIYKLFKSKEEIYIELIHKNTDEFIEAIRTILAKYTTAKGKLSALFNEYLKRKFDTYTLNSFLVFFEFQLFSTRREDMMKLLEERRHTRLDIISEVLNEGIRNGEFKEGIAVDIYAEMFWAFFDGVIETQLLFPNYPFEKLAIEQSETFIKKLLKD